MAAELFMDPRNGDPARREPDEERARIARKTLAGLKVVAEEAKEGAPSGGPR